MQEAKMKGSVWLFFVIAFGFSWLFWVPLALAEQGFLSLPDGLYQFLSGSQNPAAYGPFVAAFLMTGIYEGWSGVKALIKRGLDFKIGWKWYLVVFFLLPLLIGLPLLVAQMAGETIPESWAVREAGGAPLSIFAVIAFFVIFTSFVHCCCQNQNERAVPAPTLRANSCLIVPSIFCHL